MKPLHQILIGGIIGIILSILLVGPIANITKPDFSGKSAENFQAQAVKELKAIKEILKKYDR